MLKSGTVGIACLALAIAACSSSNGADGGGGGSGASASVGGNGQSSLGGIGQSNLGGAGQTDVGGAGQNLGGAGQNVGGAGVTVTGGRTTQGGAVSNGGGPTPIGGATSCGTTACGTGMCGSIVDACGMAQDCGVCANGATCGQAVQNTCDAPCTPITCADKGANCGYLSDGCGKVTYCGDCATGEVCGATAENVCASPTPGGGNPCADPTAGFCPQLADCTGQAPTTLSGTVLAPNGTMPLPNALIYVPNGSTVFPYGVNEFVDGVANNTACTCDTSGTPLVSTVSGPDGTFTLTGVPAGANIPLVIQLGRWRRLVEISNIPQCATTALTAAQTKLPSRQDMGNSRDAIPLMALSTGRVDAIECVIRKMGVEDSQFSNAGPNGGLGRIRFYRDRGASCTTGGGSCQGTTPAYGRLTTVAGEIDQYDAVIYPCDGEQHDVAAAEKTVIMDVATNTNAYVNKGGRAFFTHYSYGFLYNQQPAVNLPWLGTTNAANDGPHHDPTTQVQIDTTFPRGATFAQWLGLPAVNALSQANPPTLGIDESREVVRNPATWNNTLTPIPALRWAFYPNNNPGANMLHVTFDTPWGLPPEKQCGRVLYSGFHVTTAAIAGAACTNNGQSTQNCTFPQECNATFTPQEKALAYFLFDMTSCVQPPNIECIKKTCADRGRTCGLDSDGCGGVLDCGPCCIPQSCDQACTDPAKNCSSTNANPYLLECPIADGCSGTVNCFCKIG